jgi:hypothetical protein
MVLPEGCRHGYPEILVLMLEDKEEKNALVKTSFHSDDTPCASPAPLRAGAKPKRAS